MSKKDKAAIFAVAAIAILLPIVTCTVFVSKTESETLYPQTAIVVSTNESQNILNLMTATGHVFTYETPIEDWLPGDICSLIMSTKGTVSIKDDEIIEIWYSGRPEDYTYLPYDGKGMMN